MNKDLSREKEAIAFLNHVTDEAPVDPYELHTNAVLDAQALYLRFTPLLDIANETLVPLPLLRDLVYKKGGWREQRDQMHREVKEQAKEHARKKLQKAYQVSIRLITKGLLSYEKRYQRQGLSPDLEEIEAIAKVLTRLDKAKLNAEDPLADKRESFTPQDLVKAIASDPYLRKSFQANSALPVPEEDDDLQKEEYERENTDSLAHSKRPKT